MTESLFHSQLAELIVRFQLIENEIREVSWFCSEPSAVSAGPRAFGRLIKHALRVTDQFLTGHGVELKAAIRERLESAFQRCVKLAETRNIFAHSVFRKHADRDGPALVRTTTKSMGRGRVDVQHEEVNDSTLQPALHEAQGLYSALFSLHRELMHELRSACNTS